MITRWFLPPVRGWMTLEERADLVQRVAAHIGAASVDDDERMACPGCGGDYGPTMTIDALSVYELGYLPGTPLLVGVCLDCGHIVEPAAVVVADDIDELIAPPARRRHVELP